MGIFFFEFTATKKRNRESISQPLPDSKKLNHKISGVELFIKNGAKKSKLSMVSPLYLGTIEKFLSFCFFDLEFEF